MEEYLGKVPPPQPTDLNSGQQGSEGCTFPALRGTSSLWVDDNTTPLESSELEVE